MATTHKCAKLFYLEVTDTEEEDPSDQEEPLISLHAISGVRTADTQQVRVQVGDQEFTALIDTGSTHNFFSTQAAQDPAAEWPKMSRSRWGMTFSPSMRTPFH
jgi:hypothetical protein